MEHIVSPDQMALSKKDKSKLSRTRLSDFVLEHNEATGQYGNSMFKA